MGSGGRLGGISHDRTTWLVLLCLLLGVIAPTACVLWFMNQAAKPSHSRTSGSDRRLSK